MKRILLVIFFFVSFHWCFSQKSYHYSLTITPETCLKGAASLAVGSLDTQDSIETIWSTGEKNTFTVSNLNSGKYFVQSIIIYRQDSLRFLKDTTFHFVVEKVECPVNIDTYFSPNDDGYHDVLAITNIQYFPEFEFIIFNKWGQQIHSQKQSYKPWDGKWNGAEVPDGSYYYIFFFDAADKGNMLKGHVTIIR